MLWSMGHHQHRIPLFTGEFVALVNVIYTLHAGDHRSRRTKTPVLWDFTDPDISTSEDTLQPSVNLFMFILLSFPFVLCDRDRIYGRHRTSIHIATSSAHGKTHRRGNHYSLHVKYQHSRIPHSHETRIQNHSYG